MPPIEDVILYFGGLFLLVVGVCFAAVAGADRLLSLAFADGEPISLWRYLYGVLAALVIWLLLGDLPRPVGGFFTGLVRAAIGGIVAFRFVTYRRNEKAEALRRALVSTLAFVAGLSVVSLFFR